VNTQGSSSFDRAIVWSFFTAILGMACLMPMQNDTWWHLRAGQEMWARRFVMLADEFSFTVPGYPWPNHEWLSEIVFYALYAAGGLPLLTLFAAACVTLALGLSWRLMEGDSIERLAIMGLAMTSIVPVWTVRPHVFTLVLVMIVVHLSLRRYYWPIPFIFVLWSNLHGGVALGMVALGGVLAGRMYLTGMSEVRAIGVVLLASFAATFITPLGVGLWTTIPESIHKSSVNQIVEWSFPSPLEGTYTAFWIVAIVFAATTVWFRGRITSGQHAVLVAVALAILPLAIKSRRNIPPFLLIAIPALSHNLAILLSARRARTPKAASARQQKLNVVFVGLTVLVCAGIVSVAWTRRIPRLRWQPIPTDVITEVEACGDRVFNRYPDGGPLIWFAPGVKVFIDSRQDPYPLSFTQEYVALDRTGEYRQMFERYGVSCAMLPERSITTTRLRQDGWRTRVASEGWVVLQMSDQRAGTR
jgi:hypothetical protein